MAVGRSSLARWVIGLGLSALVLLLLALLLTWSRRDRIARSLIGQELARRGVAARYRIVAIGVRTERIADLSVGDPAHPDLTAREVTVRLDVGLGGVSIRGVEASGVRLRGAIVDGSLQLGSLDRLLPAGPAGRAFALPAFNVTLHDARIGLSTAAGEVGLAIEGSGPLNDGFGGRIAIAAHRLALAGCDGTGVTAVLHLATHDGAPLVDGPVAAGGLACGAARLISPQAQVDVRLSPSLDQWHGGARISAARLLASGAAADDLGAQIGFSGRAARTLIGLDAQTGRVATATFNAGSSALSGRAAVGGGGVRGEADVSVSDAAASPTLQRTIVEAAARTRGSPVAPIADALGRSARSALARFDLGGRLLVAAGQGRLAADLSRAAARSASGAELSLASGAHLSFSNGRLALLGGARLGGGGLPSMLFTRTGPGSWLLRSDPVVADGARLDLAPVHIATDGSGIRATTVVTRLDGPLPNGRVSGLTLPLQIGYGAGSLRVEGGCTPVRWGSMRLSTLALAAGSLNLCPARGATLAEVGASGAEADIRFGNTRLSGTLAGSPLHLELGGGAFALAPLNLRLSAIRARIGDAGSASILDLARLDAGFRNGAIGGTFGGGRAALASVPFLLSNAEGRWTYGGGTLAIDGLAGGLTDRVVPARIRALAVAAGSLRLMGSKVTATADLREPRGGGHLATVRISHDLSAAAGDAQLAVRTLVFGPHLQPEQITPLTLGVVADLAGSVEGDARIDWAPGRITSTGRFSTARMDLAAAFGPVQNLSGTIVFDDLLGFHTPPGQVAHVASINPGIEVTDGTIAYQLLSAQRIAVESGSWPLAGGTLTLRPTMLDFATGSTRHLTLDVRGLDAARFVQQMELDNLAVTGTFDGTLPLVFDAEGGRITGGHLVARAGGGTLSYVGEVSNAQLGTFGKLAFDALKSLRYHSLALDLEGSLDGEVVSRIAVAGVNQQPVAAGSMGKGFTGLPFRFNIAVRAPFRGLMNSARSFSNPGLLLHPGPDTGVQPPASGTGASLRSR